MGKQVIVTQNNVLLFLILGLLLIILCSIYFLYYMIRSIKHDIKTELTSTNDIIDQTMDQFIKNGELDPIAEEVEEAEKVEEAEDTIKDITEDSE